VRILVAVLVATLALAGCSSDPRKAPDHRLPDVSLASLHGGPALGLRSLRGPAVVNLWASWCLPCKRELPIYAQFDRAHRDRVSVIGVDFQETDHDAARRLMERSKVAYPVVADPDGALRAIGLPELVLVDADGTIAYQEYVEIKSLAQLEGIVEKHLGVTL
jgi:cytochrome c biogenesis protein CcmG, thiol:disulfide interchange protein DsbE